MSIEDLIKEEGEFRYVEQGEGPVLMFLHGLFGALSNFENSLAHFSKSYTVVIPMLPIYELPVINTNVGNLAKFLHRFIEHKGWKEVNLVGNSLGGHVGLVHTHKHPEKIRTLSLTGSSGLYENAFGGGFPRREDKEFLRKKIEVTFYDPKHADDELVDECYEIVNDKGKLIRILSLARSAIKHNMGDDLGDFKMPVCLIWGKQDSITPPHVAEEFNEKMPHSELYWIDECAHAAMMEQPEEFNRLLDDWLSKTLGTASATDASVTQS